MLSFLVLILELSQAFVREAILVKYIRHGNPAYSLQPGSRNSPTSDTGFGMLGSLFLVSCDRIVLIFQQDGTISNTEYSEEHHSPIFSCLISFVCIVKKKI